MQDARASVGTAWRGLIAGCGWATYLVQMHVLAPLDQWAATHSYIRLAMFIDDLLLQCHASSYDAVISRMNMAARSLARCIKHELKRQIATKKSQVLASSQDLQNKLRKTPGTLAGPSTDISGPNLGMESGAGRPQRRRRKGRKLMERINKIKKRMARIKMIKHDGGN
eukprot:440583-Pyramimonas_sp.AAC.1